jgi:hypothetical protein
MAESRGSLVRDVSAVSGLIFTIGIFLVLELPGPGQPFFPSFIGGVVAAVVAVSICIGLLIPSNGGADESPQPGSKSTRTNRLYGKVTARAVPLVVLAVIVVLVLTLSTVQVARNCVSGPQQFDISFAPNPVWNHTVTMGGFGQIVFNWSEVGTYNLLHITLTSASGSFLFYNPSTTSGSGGVVAAPGVYFINVQEGASTDTEAYLTLETDYTTTGYLLSW